MAAGDGTGSATAEQTTQVRFRSVVRTPRRIERRSESRGVGRQTPHLDPKGQRPPTWTACRDSRRLERAL